ncbi:FAD-binding oxidoreductase [Agromyces sp. NPDC049794]|uniref:FAD-binding oxidoreductase n=1 Tax=unclassified Agromyces TaxID=2639701 RepID=UPI0034113500
MALQHALGDLRGSLDGEALAPGAPGFADATRTFNGRHREVQPAIIVRCASNRDVATALAFARQHGMPVAIRSGGHSFAALSTTTGIVVDTGPMDGITITGNRVIVGAGVQLGQLYDALAPHGLTIPGGTCPTVGIAGLTLGGGLGILGRSWGVTSDRLIRAEAVLADGTLVTCDANQHPDLFWALRGGGTAGLAVVTTLTFEAVPAPGHAVTFHARWPIAAASNVIAAWQRWAPDEPDALAASLKVTVPAVEEPRVDLYATWFGDPGDGVRRMHRFTRQLGEAGAAAADVASMETDARGARRFWADLGQATADTGAGGESEPGAEATQELLYSTSQYFDGPMSPRTTDRLLEVVATERRHEHARELDFMPWGGAYNRTADADSAFVHRHAAFLLKLTTTLPLRAPSDARDAASEHLKRMADATRPSSTGRAFQNFADSDQLRHAEAFYGTNLQRLRDIRAHYDPGGLLSQGHSLD